MIRAAVLTVTLAVAALFSVGARAEGDPACAKIEEPLAYNACLAAHGPKATDVRPHFRSSREPTAPASAVAPRAARPKEAYANRWYGAYVPRRHGRAHAEFRVR